MTAPEVDQIRIGRHMFGIVGLKDAFGAIAGEHAEKPDDVLAGMLVARLAGMGWLKSRQVIYKAGSVLMILVGIYFIIKAIQY